MEDDNSQLEGLEDTEAPVEYAKSSYYDDNYKSEQLLTLGRSILRNIQDVHYTIKDSSLKKEQLEILLAYRDMLVSKLT